MKQYIIKFIIIACSLVLCMAVHAQEESFQLHGTVTDESGRPLAGITVSTADGRDATVTDHEGRYTLGMVTRRTEILYSAPGFRPLKTEVDDLKESVTLQAAGSYDCNEQVYLGYTSQRAGELSGAVSRVTGDQLQKSPVTNLSMALAGRLPGLFTSESNSEPFRTSTNLYVRGVSSIRGNQPIVIIDGTVIGYNTISVLDNITPAEIESISVLKDASVQALYGIQGGDGVIVVTTRRGTRTPFRMNVRFDQTFQQRSTEPAFIGSAEYAELRNQAARNDGLGDNYYYSDEEIGKFRSGEDRELYPENNWRDMFLRDVSHMQRLGFDLQYGNDKVRFYTNINLLHQGGFYHTDDSRDYKPNNNNFGVNFRSNADVKLNKYLTGSLRLAGNIRREKTPGGGALGTIYEQLLYRAPTVYGPVTPEQVDPQTGEVIQEGGGVIVTDKLTNAPYGMINRMGYIQRTGTNIYAQFQLDLDMSFLTPGLGMNGSIAYHINSSNNLVASQTYQRWIRSSNTPEPAFEKYGTAVDGALTYGKTYNMFHQMTYQCMIHYDRAFGRHRVGAMGYAFYQDLSKDDFTSPALLPYRRISSGFEASYNYDDRYLLKFDVGYSGSEQYARDNRFSTTPAVSGAWLVSNEKFLRDSKWLSLLKLRASYGKTGIDRTGLGRYIYLDNLTIKAGGPIGSLLRIVTESQVANPFIEPEFVKKQNYGIELGLFDQLTVSVDLFREKMDNMVIGASATVPTYQGAPLGTLPKTNTGGFKNEGYEVALDYARAFGSNLTVNVGGYFSCAKNTVTRTDESPKGEDYAYRNWWEGYSFGQEFGYLIDRSNGNGFFNSQQELSENDKVYEFGTPRVGDLRYVDLNKDGYINEKDKAPVGTGTLPRYYYAFYGNFMYKSFDLSVLFQGVGEYSRMASGVGIFEYEYDGVFGSLHRNAWTEERYRTGQAIDSPALSTRKGTSHTSNEYYLYDRSYLRLKSLEIGYTLPTRISRAITANSIRLCFSAHNLFTWDKMKSDDFGPEGNYASVPVYRFYNLGLSVKF